MQTCIRQDAITKHAGCINTKVTTPHQADSTSTWEEECFHGENILEMIANHISNPRYDINGFCKQLLRYVMQRITTCAETTYMRYIWPESMKAECFQDHT